MAKKSVGKTMPPSVAGTIPEIKSSNELKEEVKKMDNNESLIEKIAKENASEKVEDNVIDEEKTNDKEYISNAKMSPAFAKKLAKKEEKIEKKKTMIYLDENVMKQFKTLSRQSGYSITKLFEMACLDYIKGQEIDETLVADYDKVNSKKGARKNK